MSLRQRIEADSGFLFGFRHDLHQHPELMFQERRTSQKVQEALTAAGIEFVAGLAKGTGVLGWIPPTEPGGHTIALRADMDALPILEETGLDYASQTPGCMHACGHDGHTTILLGAARALAAEPVRRNGVLLVFQPAEEGGAGGNEMCRDGALDGSRIGSKADVIYGLHGWPARPQGHFSTKSGALMASTNTFSVTLRGRGGHAAAPELSTDPTLCLAHCITAIQGIVSRSVAPVQSAVVSVTMIQGGTVTNVIPEHVWFSGTVRTLDETVRGEVLARFDEVVQGVASAFRCQAEIQWEEGYPVTFNDDWATDRWFRLAPEVFGPERVSLEPYPKLGAEDFSYYGHHVPACFYFVGLAREGETDPPGLHTPRFDFNDGVIVDCVEMMCRLALAPLDLNAKEADEWVG